MDFIEYIQQYENIAAMFLNGDCDLAVLLLKQVEDTNSLKCTHFIRQLNRNIYKRMIKESFGEGNIFPDLKAFADRSHGYCKVIDDIHLNATVHVSNMKVYTDRSFPDNEEIHTLSMFTHIVFGYNEYPELKIPFTAFYYTEQKKFDSKTEDWSASYILRKEDMNIEYFRERMEKVFFRDLYHYHGRID